MHPSWLGELFAERLSDFPEGGVDAALCIYFRIHPEARGDFFSRYLRAMMLHPHEEIHGCVTVLGNSEGII